jgi:hypothetical protein
MKYKIEPGNEEVMIPDTVMVGNDLPKYPDYNFGAPESFETFGLMSFMEGVFEFPGKSMEEVRTFLNSLGYMEVI